MARRDAEHGQVHHPAPCQHHRRQRRSTIAGPCLHDGDTLGQDMGVGQQAPGRHRHGRALRYAEHGDRGEAGDGGGGRAAPGILGRQAGSAHGEPEGQQRGQQAHGMVLPVDVIGNLPPAGEGFPKIGH
jgi:hypothetical protein